MLQRFKTKTKANANVVLACTVALGTALLAPLQARAESEDASVKHVLLISVDGMHERDLQRYVSDPEHKNSAFARLMAHGVSFTNAHSARPSDSFPGLMAFMTGGSPKSHGIFYDDSYDRTLYAPGSKCVGKLGAEVQYAENLDIDINDLYGGGGVGSNHIDPAQLPMRWVNGKCETVLPHQFLKVNTIMEVIHAAGKRTAWSDKHPAYEIVSGPSGKGVDDLYTPEINSVTVASSGLVLGAPANAVWTDNPAYTRVYDNIKVTAVLNQIMGKNSRGTEKVGVPAIFGMNFQSVSVGQKVTAAGYADAAGTPSAELQKSLEFVDASLGRMLDALDDAHLTRKTLFIVGAKHGQSPIDVATLHMQVGSANPKLLPGHADVVDPADVLSNGGVALRQETSDDVALVWLDKQDQVPNALALLDANRSSGNSTKIEKVYAGAELTAKFGNPMLGRTPDIIIQPIPGTIYSSSKKKISEHGGFADDDTHVLLVVANPKLEPKTVSQQVANQQVAPTILKALGLEPDELEAVRKERTEVLPGLDFKPRLRP
jgi:hypothetical protein